MIDAGAHQIGDMGVSGRRRTFPWSPTVMHTENTFGGPSLLDHPEPARCRLVMWLPAWAEPYMPRLGSALVGDAVVGGERVTYFSGAVDEIRAGRMRGADVPGVERMPAPWVGTRSWWNDAAPFETPDVERSGVWSTFTVTGSPGAHVLVRMRWTASITAVRSSALLVAPVPSNVSTFDMAAATSLAVVPPTAPAVTVTDCLDAPAPNRTAYRIKAGAASRPTVSVDLDVVIPSSGKRTVSVPDPAIVSTAGGQDVRGRYVQIDASDWTAPAARVRIGDKPFSFESPSKRWNNIAPLVTAAGLPCAASSASMPGGELGGPLALQYTSGLAVTCKPLDIDRRQALEVLQRTAMTAVGALVISDRMGIRYKTRPTPYNVLRAPASGTLTAGPNPAVTNIPSSVVEEVPRMLSSASIVNQVEYDVTVANNQATELDERVEVIRDDESIAAYTPSPIRLNADAMMFWVADGVGLSVRARSLMRGEPTWTLEGEVELASLAGVTNAARLIDPSDRHGHGIYVTGPLPDDVPPQWRVRGGSFTVGRKDRITLVLDPASWLPDLGASFTDVAALRPSVTFADFGTITFDNMKHVEV